MKEDDLRSAVALGREQRATEFKGPGPCCRSPLLYKVIRAMLGMANLPDGGTVVLGVEDDGVQLITAGIASSDIETWTYDNLASHVSNFADPYVDFNVSRLTLDKKEYVCIEVQPFAEIPVLCKRDYDRVLRDGALYVRGRGKIETVEVSGHALMREVIERASLLGASRILRQQAGLGLDKGSPPTPSDRDMYDAEAQDLL